MIRHLVAYSAHQCGPSTCPGGSSGPSNDTTYYFGRMRLVPTGPAPMMRWRKRLFVLMARPAGSAPDFFSVPLNRVVELGARVEF